MTAFEKAAHAAAVAANDTAERARHAAVQACREAAAAGFEVARLASTELASANRGAMAAHPNAEAIARTERAWAVAGKLAALSEEASKRATPRDENERNNESAIKLREAMEATRNVVCDIPD